MRRHISIYRKFVAQYLKKLLEYRTDFIIGILSFVFIQASGILFLYLVFQNINELNGWSFEELLLIYAVFQIPRGIDHLLTDNIWLIPNYIIRGEFDKYLLKPLNVLYSIISELFQIEAIGELLVGIGLLIYVFPVLNIHLVWIDLLFIPLLIISGTVIYTSIKLFTATFAFWIKNSNSVMVAFYDVAEFTKQPLSIYPKNFQFLLKYIVPFAFTSYFPSAYLLGKGDGLSIVLQSIVVSIIAAILAYSFWLKGLKTYESVGN
ncbi:MAG: ABC-2 family transporter protein [Acholeplasmataceae bacterium]|nr:ABC-2 family transporter protein [Acholeplasmataceae bacterium]